MRPASPPGAPTDDRAVAQVEAPIPEPSHGRDWAADGPRVRAGRAERSRRRGWRWVGYAVGALLVAGAAGVTVLFLARSGHPPVRVPGRAAPITQPKPPFTFPLTSVHGWTIARHTSAAAARPAAEAIATTLNSFYQHAFLDPSAWSGHVSSETWDVFAPSIRSRAVRDARALTIGKPGERINTLEASRSTLQVRVLVDASGDPQAAFADVTFSASGTVAGGDAIGVSNAVHFLLRPSDGGWRITGYVDARTEVQTPGGGTEAGPTSAPSAGGSP